MYKLASEVKPFSADDKASYAAATAHVLAWGPIPAATTYTPQQAKVISQLYERYIDPIYNGMGSRLWTTYISRNPYEGGRKPTGAQAMHTILRWFIRETEKDTLTNTEAASLFYTHMEGVVEYQQLIKYVWTEASPNH